MRERTEKAVEREGGKQDRGLPAVLQESDAAHDGVDDVQHAAPVGELHVRLDERGRAHLHAEQVGAWGSLQRAGPGTGGAHGTGSP